MAGYQINDQLQRMSKAVIASLFQAQLTSNYLLYKQFFCNQQKSYR